MSRDSYECPACQGTGKISFEWTGIENNAEAAIIQLVDYIMTTKRGVTIIELHKMLGDIRSLAESGMEYKQEFFGALKSGQEPPSWHEIRHKEELDSDGGENENG